MTISPQEIRQLTETHNVGASDSVVLFRDNKVVRTTVGDLGRFIRGDVPSFNITESTSIAVAGNYWVDATLDDVIITLPSLVGFSGNCYIKKVAGNNNVIITGGLIDGEESQTITQLWNGVTVIPNGTNWYIGK
jgi:hypothetical protein